MTENVPAPVPTQKTNSLAIVGLILAFFFPFVGLILSIVALNQIKKRNEGGKGLAVAGTILSAVLLVLEIITIIALSILFFFSFQDTAKSMAAEDNVNALHSQLELYYEDAQNYPSFAQLNDPAWRDLNMSGLNPDVFSGEYTSTQLGSQPTQDVIAYQPTAEDGGACDGEAISCSQYTLLVGLTRDRVYEKQSLDASTLL